VLLTALLSGTLLAQSKSLQIYVVDVEGGNATLFVTPSGESVLIDTGNPGARDADRIAAAAKDAGIKQIDHLITTHWHGDHFGGMTDVNERVPIRHFVDHGPTTESQPRTDEFLAKAYPALVAKGKRTIVKPGDRLPVKDLDWRIVTAHKQTLKESLPGGGAANRLCDATTPPALDNTDNSASVGSVVAFGSVRIMHLGDLTQDKDYELMCPTNRVGTIDLFIVSHHGLAVSNAEMLVHGVNPRVAIMNNGIRKGAAPGVMKTLLSSPRMNKESLWMLHASQVSGAEYPPAEQLVANTQPDAHNDGPAHWIKVVAQPNGTLTVSNQRNGFSKTYSR
jgi:beta-lactamase superfamily II metal-dependent hydrolase